MKGAQKGNRMVVKKKDKWFCRATKGFAHRQAQRLQLTMPASKHQRRQAQRPQLTLPRRQVSSSKIHFFYVFFCAHVCKIFIIFVEIYVNLSNTARLLC